MNNIPNNVISNSILSLNSQFNYHSRFPKSILKNKSQLLKLVTSSKFDDITDNELNKRLNLARENAHTNRKFLLMKSDAPMKVMFNHMKKVMPMQTRAQARRLLNDDDSKSNKLIDYKENDLVEVERFRKISSTDGDLMDLMTKMDKDLNSSIKTVTGISPNELDKGRKLREVVDLDKAMATLKKGIENGMTINGAMDYLNNVQKSLQVMKAIRA